MLCYVCLCALYLLFANRLVCRGIQAPASDGPGPAGFPCKYQRISYHMIFKDFLSYSRISLHVEGTPCVRKDFHKTH